MNEIRDRYERVIDYMRISIIDRCNLRCIYCMPEEGIKPLDHTAILRYEEIIRIVRIAAELGVKKIRLTGGEPLIRRNLTYLISSIADISGIEDISLTTNGVRLKHLAPALAEAGLKRVNVSLDSLRPDRYKEITRGGDLRIVLDGIAAAEHAGLHPVKINMVPIRGFNDDEIEDFARLTLKGPAHVRFIEFMPIGATEFWNESKYLSSEEIKNRVERIAPLMPVKVRRNGPARYFRVDGAPGVIGFISPLTHHFCGSCNRLRLTSDGKLRPCLFSETEIDLKSALRSGASDKEIERLLRLAVEIKPNSHNISQEKSFYHLKPMSKIGG
ncbi:MAG: GTP 3',8-cyclase MoaA [Dissulfurispiraceae bacterium]|jgi:GTP 3',8-cyclase